ncbi:MAG: MoaD/ThiS family protein [Anaerolineae bacterium]
MTMRITVRLLASYRRYLPGGQDEQAGYCDELPAGRMAGDEQAGYCHTVPSGSTVSDLLAGLPIPAGDVFTFFVNGRHAERGQALQEGDVISIFPAVGGG